MPTADRPDFVPLAIRYFLRQDYANRELVVIDDGARPVQDLIPQDSRIRYLRLPRRETIGAKRNLACEESRGEIIAHWDDDDWMADWRLSFQMRAVAATGERAVCGLSTLFFYNPAREAAWLYSYPSRERRWLAGNTLCYAKSLWRDHRFPNVNEGEDTRFVWSLPDSAIRALPDPAFYVAIVHERNTSPKRTQDSRWRPVPVTEVGAILGRDIELYTTRRDQLAPARADALLVGS